MKSQGNLLIPFTDSIVFLFFQKAQFSRGELFGKIKNIRLTDIFKAVFTTM